MWVEVVEPAQMRAANTWVASCRSSGEATRVQPVYQSPRLLSLACRGGAGSRFASFRIADGHRLVLADTIQNGKMGQLQQAAVKAARKRGLPEEFPAPDEFALTAAGFVFALGGADVVIPSIDMRPLLQADTALLVGR